MTQVEDIAHHVAQSTQADLEDTILAEHTHTPQTTQHTLEVTSQDLSILLYKRRRL